MYIQGSETSVQQNYAGGAMILFRFRASEPQAVTHHAEAVRLRRIHSPLKSRDLATRAYASKFS